MFTWQVKAVDVQDAMEQGTGLWEPFGYDPEQGTIFVKQFVEVETSEKSTEVSGAIEN